MASRTSIANNALRHLKNSKTLTDVDTDTSLQAITIRAFFDEAMSEMTRMYEWPPLKTTVALAEVTPNINDDEWGFSYSKPSDCEKARYIVDGNMDPTPTTPRIAFEMGSDGSDELIFTDQEDATLCYTRTCDDVTIMSAKWRRALEYKIATLIAPTLCGEDRTGLGDKAEKMFILTLDEAWAEYLNERQRLSPPESEFITGR